MTEAEKTILGEVRYLRAEIGVILDKHDESIKLIREKCAGCDIEKKTKESVYYRVGYFLITAVFAAGLVYSFTNIVNSDTKKEEKNTNLSSVSK